MRHLPSLILGNILNMYTRWIQAGAFSGVMRSHDRGMSAGDCDDALPSTCSIVQPWKVPPQFLPANVQALQAREELLPYIYTQARAAFDTGVGLIIPMYYDHPDFDEAYLTDANGTFSQYMFGPSILVAPVVTQGSAFLGGGYLTPKTVWLPPGLWCGTLFPWCTCVTYCSGTTPSRAELRSLLLLSSLKTTPSMRSPCGAVTLHPPMPLCRPAPPSARFLFCFLFCY